MNSRWLRLRISLVAMLCAVMLAPHLASARGGGAAFAQAPAASGGENAREMDVTLYVLDPHFTNGRKAITLVWLPQPLQKYCLGKSFDQCATTDYCIRTTNKFDARCKNLGVDTAHISFPADMVPKRMLSVTLMYPFTLDHGFGDLKTFFESAAAGSLDKISSSSRIKARVKFTHTPTDDGFHLDGVLSAPLAK
jgi:hypothetical protein